MLSKATAQILMALPFRADAKRHVCMLPLGSIYWDDEAPDLVQIMRLPEDDRNQVLRLFSIRFRIWDGETLSDDDQNFWENTRQQVPNWALFWRLELSADDRRAREETEAAVEKELGAFFAAADQVTVAEHEGVQTFSAKFDLAKRPSEGPRGHHGGYGHSNEARMTEPDANTRRARIAAERTGAYTRSGNIMERYVERREGGYYVAGTRISLDSVLLPFKEGASPESILRSFPLFGSLEKVYGAITFYLADKEEVESYLREQERLSEELTSKQSPLPETLSKKLHRAREEALPR